MFFRKTNIVRLSLFKLFLCFVIFFPSCVDSPHKIRIVYDSVQIFDLGASVNISAEVLSKNGKIIPKSVMSWKTSDPGVAFASDGIITSVGSGATTVTVSIGNIEKNISVFVSIPYSLKSNYESINLTQENPNAKVVISVLNEKGKPWLGEPSFVWKIDNEEIATIDTDGNVKALSSGNTVLLVTMKNIKLEIPIQSLFQSYIEKLPVDEDKTKEIATKQDKEVLVDNKNN